MPPNLNLSMKLSYEYEDYKHETHVVIGTDRDDQDVNHLGVEIILNLSYK